MLALELIDLYPGGDVRHLAKIPERKMSTIIVQDTGCNSQAGPNPPTQIGSSLGIQGVDAGQESERFRSH